MQSIQTFVLFGFVTLIAGNINSASAESKNAKFIEHKEHAIHEFAVKISVLDKAKKCVTAAADSEELKLCYFDLEKEQKKLKAEELEHEIHRLEDEKAKLAE